MFNITILTLFPEMFPAQLGMSLAGTALEKGLWNLKTINIRDFATDKHKNVDDTPYGGGAGMVMRADVLANCLDFAIENHPTQSTEYKTPKIIYMSPRGALFNQKKSKEFLQGEDLIIICGRYEGIDQRFIDEYNIEEISIGDFILSGGEIAALTVIDACVRQIDGVLNNPSTLVEESFGCGEFENLLEYPIFTRPAIWRDRKVPDVLLGGNHKLINQWRLQQSQEITQQRREDLWEKHLRNLEEK